MVFAVGDKVRSVKVGRTPAFDAEVVEAVPRRVVEVRDNAFSTYRGYYHVRDVDGALWHRDHADLTAS